MKLDLGQIDWELASTFRIAYRVETHIHTVRATLTDGDFTGRGEGIGVSYKGETAASMLAQLEAVRGAIESGLSREALQDLLPPGGARNALDCAYWDLEAKMSGRRAFARAGLAELKPLMTAYTLSLEPPEVMARAARAAADRSILKLKLGGDNDLDRVRAVRQARPDARIIVDANQSWLAENLRDWTPQMAALGVELIEQPLPAGDDEALRGFEAPVPICADESCQTTGSLAGLEGKYRYVNIKLDKTGGLTEALELARAATARGFGLMVGCMAGSSLSMAPAFIVGQMCDFVDLDGPLLARHDIEDGIAYDGSLMSVPESTLWG